MRQWHRCNYSLLLTCKSFGDQFYDHSISSLNCQSVCLILCWLFDSAQYVKCGFASENFPTSVFPCVVGRPMLRYEESLLEQEITVGFISFTYGSDLCLFTCISRNYAKKIHLTGGLLSVLGNFTGTIWAENKKNFLLTFSLLHDT